jgi:YggT family protein
MRALAAYAAFVGYVRIGLLYAGIAAAAICALDWAVRSRHLSPFGRIARFTRARIDPAMRPIERMVVRAGGVPTAAPWWALVAVVVLGIVLITLLQFLGSLLGQVVFAAAEPSRLPLVIIGWAFSVLKLAIIVRVIASWVPLGRFARWIRWAFFLTEWMLAPLRRIIPLIGMIDITPIVAWLLLSLLQSLLGIP